MQNETANQMGMPQAMEQGAPAGGEEQVQASPEASQPVQPAI